VLSPPRLRECHLIAVHRTSVGGLTRRELSFPPVILQGPEAVAAALAGCKILKEMARLESEAESARSMKEAKYEQFALGESRVPP